MLKRLLFFLIIVLATTLSAFACGGRAQAPASTQAQMPVKPVASSAALPEPTSSPTPRTLPTPTPRSLQLTSTPLPTPEPPPSAPSSAGTSQGLFIGTSDLPELVESSTVIILGTINDSIPREESLPTVIPSQRSLVRVYDVSVERYLKGESEEVLSVIQYDGIEHIDPLDGKLRQSRYPSSEILPKRGEEYVLF